MLKVYMYIAYRIYRLTRTKLIDRGNFSNMKRGVGWEEVGIVLSTVRKSVKGGVFTEEKFIFCSCIA